MISRVTHQTVQRFTLANLQVNLAKMSDLQGKLSGGRVITKPSDDPGGTAQAMQLRAEKRATEQFSRNATDGVAWLSTIDTALQSSVAALRNARNLTVQGANSGAVGQVSKDAIAMELEGIRDALRDQANTTYLGRSIFAGTSNAGLAFQADYSWTGTPGATVERRLAEDTTVRADADGVAAYGTGAWDDATQTGSVFALVDRVATALRNGEDVSGYLGAIDERMESMLGELADVGARYGQMLTAQETTERTLMNLKGSIAAVEDIDLAAVLVELQSQEVAYQAALGATQRVLQPSLMDFLR